MLRTWWLWCVLSMVGVALPGIAWASPGEVTIALETDGRPESPGWVCVVSQGQSHSQDDAVWLEDALKAAPEGQLSTANAEKLAGSIRAYDWSRSESVETMVDVLNAMAPSNLEPACGGAPGKPQLCAATVAPEALTKRSLICTANERQAGAPKRVLWLEVSSRDAQSAKAYVDEISLNGAVLTIGTNLRGREAVKVVTSVGGHYLAGAEVRTASADAIVLQLESRCRWVRVEVPPIDLPTGGRGRPVFTLEHDGQTTEIADACVRGSVRAQSLALRLPHGRRASVGQATAPMRLVGTIEQKIPALPNARIVAATRHEPAYPRQAKPPAEGAEAHQVASHEVEGKRIDIPLSARWSSSWPTEPLFLEPEVVTFFWPRSACFYPEGCPSARVAGADTTCEQFVGLDGCHYRCDVTQTNVGIVGDEFVVPVEFTDDHHGVPRPRWGGTLGRLNQRFFRSVPAGERSVKVDLHAWARDYDPGYKWLPTRRASTYDTPDRVVHAPGDEIEALTLRRSTGVERRIEFGKNTTREYFLELPDLQCGKGESFTIKVEGEREYVTTELPFAQGSIEVPHPMSMARVAYFGTGVTVGFTRVLSPSDAREAGSWGPAFGFDLSLRLRPRLFARGWRFELPRFAYLLGTQPFFPLSENPGEPSDVDGRRAYGRFMLGFVARTPQWKPLTSVRISGAFGLMASAGAPVLARHIELVGDVSPGLVPMAEVVVGVSRRIELRATPQLICLETFHRHQTDLRGAARDVGLPLRMCSVFMGAGVAGTW
ncbi:MAG: hypothetical protein AAF799_15425 [Myxococcota bacterium]